MALENDPFCLPYPTREATLRFYSVAAAKPKITYIMTLLGYVILSAIGACPLITPTHILVR